MIYVISALFLLSSNVEMHKNLIMNSGFENPIRGEWIIQSGPDVIVKRDTQESYSHSYSIHIENQKYWNTDYYGCNQTIEAPQPGTCLSLRVALKYKNLNGVAGADIHFLDPSGTRLPIYDSRIIVQSDGRGEDWKLLSIDFTIPNGTNSIRVAIFMKGQGSVWVDNISLKTCLANDLAKKSASRGAYILREEDPIIWLEFAEHKIFPDTPPPDVEAHANIRLEVARNECEPFQIVINPSKSLNNCSIEFSDLIHERTGYTINKGNLTCYMVGYVDIKEVSSPIGTKGLNPDFLINRKLYDLVADVNNPMWISLQIPDDADSGIYEGTIVLRNDADFRVKIPIEVKVWDFVLPSKGHFIVRSNFWLSLIKIYDNRQSDAILADYFENLRTHRANCYGVMNLETRRDGDSLLILFDAFDTKVTNLFNNYGFEIVILGPFLGDASGWEHRRTWMELDPESSEFEYYLKKYYRQLENHLISNGWIDRCWIQYWDEPQIDDPHFQRIAKIGRIIKEAAPKLRIFMTTKPIPELFNIVDIWCMPFNGRYFDQKEVNERKRSKQKVLVYNNDPYIDTPLIDKRLYSWRYRLADIDGVYAWWNLTFWVNNPYINPYMTEEKGGGRETPLKPGDGVLLYPNPNGAGPPVNSLRWEIFRQGLEDYEYFCLLEQNINNARSYLESNDRFEDYARLRIREIISTIVDDYFTEWNRDVSYLYDIRHRLGEEIEEVTRSPIVLVRTNPEEGEAMAENRVEIYGLTEKATKLFINGRQVPTNDDGSFYAKTVADKGTVLIKAQLNNDEKIIRRFFK